MTSTNGKTLVVVFSSKSAIYGQSQPAKIGNTMRVADMIVQDTGADKWLKGLGLMK
jgi:flavodoxin